MRVVIWQNNQLWENVSESHAFDLIGAWLKVTGYKITVKQNLTQSILNSAGLEGQELKQWISWTW